MVARLLLRAELRRGRARASRGRGDARGRRRGADAGRGDRPDGASAVGAHVAGHRLAAPHAVRLRARDARRDCASTARRRRPGCSTRGSSASTPGATTSRPGSRRCRRRASGGPRSSKATADGLLFERSFARRLGVRPGDTRDLRHALGPAHRAGHRPRRRLRPGRLSVLPAGRDVRIEGAARRARAERAVRDRVRPARRPRRGARRRRPVGGGGRRAAGDRRGRLAAAARGRQ